MHIQNGDRSVKISITREEIDRAFDERFPAEMKEKLKNARVAIAGLGGLGSNIAVNLARSSPGSTPGSIYRRSR